MCNIKSKNEQRIRGRMDALTKQVFRNAVFINGRFFKSYSKTLIAILLHKERHLIS